MRRTTFGLRSSAWEKREQAIVAITRRIRVFMLPRESSDCGYVQTRFEFCGGRWASGFLVGWGSGASIS